MVGNETMRLYMGLDQILYPSTIDDIDWIKIRVYFYHACMCLLDSIKLDLFSLA